MLCAGGSTFLGGAAAFAPQGDPASDHANAWESASPWDPPEQIQRRLVGHRGVRSCGALVRNLAFGFTLLVP